MKNHWCSDIFLSSPFMQNRYGWHNAYSFMSCFSHASWTWNIKCSQLTRSQEFQVQLLAHLSHGLGTSAYISLWDRNQKSRTITEMESQERHETTEFWVEGHRASQVLSHQMGTSGQLEKILCQSAVREVSVPSRPHTFMLEKLTMSWTWHTTVR